MSNQTSSNTIGTGQAMVPYAPPEFSSPGAKVHALIWGTTNCHLARLCPWLVEGLKENSVDYHDLGMLAKVLRNEFAYAIDDAFDDADAHRNQAQITDEDEARQIIHTLFGPDSTATFASLPQDLSSALAGFVPPDQREAIKSLLLLGWDSELQRGFEGVIARN